MKDGMFYDSNCRLGSGSAGEACLPDVPTLLSEMDYYGVDRALIRHTNIIKGALTSNEKIAEFLRNDPQKRLCGTWCILPSQCDEIPAPDLFFSQMKAARVGAITLSPFEHRYVPCRLTLGKILDAAAERKVPVLLDAFAGKWPELYAFLKEFPRLTCLYLEAVGKWGSDRNIRPLLENYEGFHVDTAGYWVPEGIRDLAEKYGAKRILYGSGLPRYNHDNGMLQLRHSGLSENDLALITGKNLESLLKGAEL